jgi:hypothetical protein
MLYKEIIAVYSHNHTKPIHCGQNTELFNVNAGSTHTGAGLAQAV